MRQRGGSEQPIKGRRTKTRSARKASRRYSPIDDPQKQLVKRLKRERDEALQLQAASAEVLKIISSSPSNLKSVFEAMLANALRICEAKFGHALLYDGERFHATHLHDVPPAYRTFWEQRGPISPSPKTGLGRLARTKQIVHIPDLKADSAYAEREPLRVVTVEQAGARSFLAVPMLKENELIGAIVIYRQEVRPFAENQIGLLRNFAAQAVIAMENARLITETRESLERQTATAEVLQVINSSPGDLAPVFEVVLEKAHSLCAVAHGALLLYDGEMFRAVAVQGLSEPLAERLRRGYIPGPNHPSQQLLEGARFAQVTDWSEIDDPIAATALDAGVRTTLFIPLCREGQLLGQIGASRLEVRPFTEKEIALLENFAAQAVIAMESARLFKEVQAKTRDLEEALVYQTGSGNILRVIASSPTDVKPVLTAIVESACVICEAEEAHVALRDGDELVFQVQHGSAPVLWKRQPINRLWVTGRSAVDRRPVHVHDYLSPEGDEFPDGRQLARRDGARTVLAVPLLREGECIGVIALRRMEVCPFSEKQIELLQTFADQAVIAISNVRLFDEVQARTRELTKSLEELRTTQDRLVQTQKLALLGQLTAGIAHEIKNPLNFVNNFSGISAELIDELRDTLRNVSLDDKARAEIEELADLLKGNFDKVVHHGRRADAIVKNMLQHSREGSGEHRIIDINALVEESLNLAWHGARAETQGFEIKLKQSFDPSAGGADVFPQDIRRALLNLIANGFYATKRKGEANNGDYEPTLTASTKNLGDHVEIRIRDNGTGIPPDVKEKMFEPFFTTKPSGEGTGLGLSISHDIVVKQHAGTIEVDTQLGAFTEIRIILPRTPAFV
jgi:signal transduction histidine kinase